MVLRKLPEYPNYTFLQLEEINQVIYNFTRNGFYDVAEISTDKIIEKFPTWSQGKKFTKRFNNLRYDFTLVSMTYESNIYTWTFKIVNTLWTGGWTLLNSDRTDYDKEFVSTTPDDADDTLILQGSNLYDFILRLEMSNDNTGRKILVDNFVFEGDYEYTHQYDSTVTEYAVLKNRDTNSYVDNATVKFVPLNEIGEKITSNTNNYLKSFTGVNKRNGRYAIQYSSVSNVGTYFGRLEAYVSGVLVAQTQVTVHKVQNYTREIMDINNLWVYKGSIQKFKIKIDTHNEYNYSINKNYEGSVVNIYHTYDVANNDPLQPSHNQKIKTDVITAYTDANGYFEFEINSRGCYVDNSYIVISLQATDNFPAWSSDKINISHRWRIATDFLDLKEECESENGADVIVLNNKTYTAPSDNPTITIGRSNYNKQYLIGEKGTGWSTIDENHNSICLKLKETENNKNFLYLRGIKITNSECAIYQENNTYLDIVSCVFTENRHLKQNYQGGVVYQEGNNTLLNCTHSYFENNYANCILGRGTVLLENNLFKITDVKYTYQPEPFVLEQYEGQGTLKNNQLYVNTSLTWNNQGKPVVSMYNKNRSYAKISCWVGKNAKINGKGINELRKDNSMNFFDAPYNNKAYIFSAYYYPYSNVKTFIVASASNSKINRATGHAVYGTNWAFKDGYNLVRESSKNYNTYNPFVSFVNGKKIVSPQILVPTSGGVW